MLLVSLPVQSNAFLHKDALRIPSRFPGLASTVSLPNDFMAFHEPSVLLASDELSAITPVTPTDALSATDIGVGIILAVLLAGLASFLQESSSSSFPNFVLWKQKDELEETQQWLDLAQDRMDQEVQALLMEDDQPQLATDITAANATTTLASNTANSTTTTSSNRVVDWEEMRRPENYIWYNKPTLKANNAPRVQAKITNDNRLAFLGLVLIFVPIFGAELFLALSRQFLCELGGSALLQNTVWANDLCAPIYKG
jgi:hypothetical protein